MTGAIMTIDRGRGDLLKVAAGGVLTGLATPLLQPVVERIGDQGGFRIALLALPFGLLVMLLLRRAGAHWAAAIAAVAVTLLAFVAAVNVAIWVDALVFDLGKLGRNTAAGLAGGCTGATLMALGIASLYGPNRLLPWVPMLLVGTLAGGLLALDNELGLTLLSLLYPIWQGGVAVGLTLALQPSTTA